MNFTHLDIFDDERLVREHCLRRIFSAMPLEDGWEAHNMEIMEIPRAQIETAYLEPSAGEPDLSVSEIWKEG